LVEVGTRKSAIVERDCKAEWALGGSFVSRLSGDELAGADSGDVDSILSQLTFPPRGRVVLETFSSTSFRLICLLTARSFRGEAPLVSPLFRRRYRSIDFESRPCRSLFLYCLMKYCCVVSRSRNDVICTRSICLSNRYDWSRRLLRALRRHRVRIRDRMPNKRPMKCNRRIIPVRL
jgi:hypothetical protein